MPKVILEEEEFIIQNKRQTLINEIIQLQKQVKKLILFLIIKRPPRNKV